jgi:hypothetical protein
MTQILNLLAPLLLWSINRENLTTRVKKKKATLTTASKKKTVPKAGAVTLDCY